MSTATVAAPSAVAAAVVLGGGWRDCESDYCGKRYDERPHS